MSTEDVRANQNPEVETEEISEEALSEQRQVRREKLKNLQEAGRNPFLVEKWDVTAHSQDIKDNFEAMEDQALDAGAEILHGRATSIAPLGDGFGVIYGADFCEAETLILCTGVAAGKVFPGEQEFLGRGVSYCVTCDGMLYRGKKVCVVGFTSDTKEEAELLRTMGCEVEMFTSRTAKYAVLGQERVTALSVNGEEHPCEAVFILRPAAAPDTLLAGLAMDGVHVAVDKVTMKTSVAGVFAAGDCTGKPYQIAKAVGDGNIAALSAAQYIEERSQEKKA